jgi:hypothetical protein
MQKVYENDGKVFAKYLQHNYPQLYSQGVWIFGDWDKVDVIVSGWDCTLEPSDQSAGGLRSAWGFGT